MPVDKETYNRFQNLKGAAIPRMAEAGRRLLRREIIFAESYDKLETLDDVNYMYLIKNGEVPYKYYPFYALTREGIGNIAYYDLQDDLPNLVESDSSINHDIKEVALSLLKKDTDLPDAVDDCIRQIISDIASVDPGLFSLRKSYIKEKDAKDLESLKEKCAKNIEKIIEPYGYKVDNEKVCDCIQRMVENVITDRDARVFVEETFRSVKAAYKEKEKEFEKELNNVRDEILNFGGYKQVEEKMGKANAKMLYNIAQEMDKDLKATEQIAHKTAILTGRIGEMQTFVENAEKQAGAGKFVKVINFLKAALKVLYYLPHDENVRDVRNAKLEFAAARFAMNDDNVKKIKTHSKELSKDISKLAQSTKNTIKKKSGLSM